MFLHSGLQGRIVVGCLTLEVAAGDYNPADEDTRFAGWTEFLRRLAPPWWVTKLHP